MARPTGASNKNKEFLMKRLKDMYGGDFDPVMMAAKNAYEMAEMSKLTLTEEQMQDMEAMELVRFTDNIFARKKECVTAFDKIAQYVTPKLKAIELSGEVEVNAHEEWLEKLSD